MMDIYEQLWAALYILIAMVLGGVIGLEREMQDKPIGFRTNMLIAGASALFILLGSDVIRFMHKDLGDIVEADPTRIIQAIVVGISFIGAGTVLKSREEQEVKYLTTAATILFSAGIGIAVAIGQFVLAILVTVLGLVTNSVLKK